MKTITIGASALALALTLSSASAFEKGDDKLTDDTFEVRRVDGGAPHLPAALGGASSRTDDVTTRSITTADPYDARGVVVPNAEVTLGAGVIAPIDSMPLRSGHAFKKGETLFTFDCRRQEADRRAAQASLAKATTFHRGKLRLLRRGAAGKQEVREAKSDVNAAAAQVDGLDAILSLCSVDAPFSGRVVERHADPYEIPAANAPVMTVVDDSKVELDLIVPSKWLRWVSVDTPFKFAVDEVGRAFEAKVVRIGAKVDAVSQTVKLTGAFRLRPHEVLVGMSGTAKFSPPLR